MEYNTYFTGELTITPTISKELTCYIQKFAAREHVKINVENLKTVISEEQLKKYSYNGDLGTEGAFYLRNNEIKNDFVIDFNTMPIGLPSLWCNFEIADGGKMLTWIKSEKTYCAVEWITYLIDTFLAPNGHTVNGIFLCHDGNGVDRWAIEVNNNVVKTYSIDEPLIKVFKQNQEIYVVVRNNQFVTIECDAKELEDYFKADVGYEVIVYRNFKKIIVLDCMKAYKFYTAKS